MVDLPSFDEMQFIEATVWERTVSNFNLSAIKTNLFVVVLEMIKNGKGAGGLVKLIPGLYNVCTQVFFLSLWMVSLICKMYTTAPKDYKTGIPSSLLTDLIIFQSGLVSSQRPLRYNGTELWNLITYVILGFMFCGVENSWANGCGIGGDTPH